MPGASCHPAAVLLIAWAIIGPVACRSAYHGARIDVPPVAERVARRESQAREQALKTLVALRAAAAPRPTNATDAADHLALLAWDLDRRALAIEDAGQLAGMSSDDAGADARIIASAYARAAHAAGDAGERLRADGRLTEAGIAPALEALVRAIDRVDSAR